jgi:hypothetical protein
LLLSSMSFADRATGEIAYFVSVALAVAGCVALTLPFVRNALRTRRKKMPPTRP